MLLSLQLGQLRNRHGHIHQHDATYATHAPWQNQTLLLARRHSCQHQHKQRDRLANPSLTDTRHRCGRCFGWGPGNNRRVDDGSHNDAQGPPDSTNGSSNSDGSGKKRRWGRLGKHLFEGRYTGSGEWDDSERKSRQEEWERWQRSWSEVCLPTRGL